MKVEDQIDTVQEVRGGGIGDNLRMQFVAFALHVVLEIARGCSSWAFVEVKFAGRV